MFEIAKYRISSFNFYAREILKIYGEILLTFYFLSPCHLGHSSIILAANRADGVRLGRLVRGAFKGGSGYRPVPAPRLLAPGRCQAYRGQRLRPAGSERLALAS